MACLEVWHCYAGPSLLPITLGSTAASHWYQKRFPEALQGKLPGSTTNPSRTFISQLLSHPFSLRWCTRPQSAVLDEALLLYLWDVSFQHLTETWKNFQLALNVVQYNQTVIQEQERMSKSRTYKSSNSLLQTLFKSLIAFKFRISTKLSALRYIQSSISQKGLADNLLVIYLHLISYLAKVKSAPLPPNTQSLLKNLLLFCWQKNLHIHFKQEMVEVVLNLNWKGKSLDVIHWHKTLIILLLFTMETSLFLFFFF